MYKFSWVGDNDGSFSCDPGKVESKICSICGLRMNVEYNVKGFVSYTSGEFERRNRLHDRFTCPNWEKDWHEKIVVLKTTVRCYIGTCDVLNNGESQGKHIVALEEQVRKIFKTAQKKP